VSPSGRAYGPEKSTSTLRGNGVRPRTAREASSSVRLIAAEYAAARFAHPRLPEGRDVRSAALSSSTVSASLRASLSSPVSGAPGAVGGTPGGSCATSGATCDGMFGAVSSAC
jgi:hypothetical protein